MRNCLFILAALVLAIPAFARTGDGPAEMAAGEEWYQHGQFAPAYAKWKEAEQAYTKEKDVEGQIRALLRESAACQALGQHRLSVQQLFSAETLAENARKRRLLAEVKAARGAISIFTREADQAEPLLQESLKLAREERATGLQASILNSLGIIQDDQGKPEEAARSFEEAAKLAQASGQQDLLGKILKNQADSALAAKDLDGAERSATLATQAADKLPDGHEKAFQLMGVGQLLEQLFIDSPDHQNSLRARAFRLYQQAGKMAETAGDQRALSYALGYEGAQYEFEKRDADALALTRRAVFLAQEAHSPDALYRFERQAGRLLAKEHQREAAIEAYRRAVATLQTIRNDVSMRFGNRNAHSSFRNAAGGTFFELADLLLQRAASLAPGDEQQALLREARDTAELLKAAELEDYFQDDCVNIVKSKIKKIESLSPKAAVVYIIALPDRTEILMGLPSGKIERFQAEVNDEKLTETVRNFRQGLEDRTSDSYFADGQQLWEWLIKPIEPLMESNHLDTLVFVPDGALRTVPMSALYDGQKFLVQKYAIAVTPGLQLMESAPAARRKPNVMIGGISEARDGFPALVNVPTEVAHLQDVFHQKSSLMNGSFLHDAIGDRIASEPYTIVHIASHGHFDDDVRKSFVLTYDKHMTLDDIERFIRPAQLRDQGLDLLTLSACQTAAGDDRAALGLAGVAVKAGARAAFATLWFVNDAASSQLVSDFYTELSTHPERTKAQALQAAQIKLLSNEHYSHPCFWGPYLIIGNWL